MSPEPRAQLAVTTRRTTPAREHHTPARHTTPRFRLAVAAPSVAVVAAAVAGVVIGLWWVVLLCGVLAVTTVGLVTARRGVATGLRRELVTAAAGVVTVAVAAAAGVVIHLAIPIVILTIGATVRITTHPTTRARREAEKATQARQAELVAYADDWPRIVRLAKLPKDVLLNGPVIDRAPLGRTYRVCTRKEDGDIGFLAGMVPGLTVALDQPWGAVTVEVSNKWPREAFVHVNDGDPQEVARATTEIRPVDTIVDTELFVGAYRADGSPYALRWFDSEVGTRHQMSVGDMGMGKSSINIRAFAQLQDARDWTIVCIDGARRDFGPWAKAGAFFRYATDPADALNILLTLEYVLEGREQFMDDNGWRVWQPSALHPVLVVLIEEIAKYAEHPVVGRKIQSILARSSKRMRAAGIKFVTSTQTGTGGGVGGYEFRRMMQDRLHFYSVESTGLLVRSKPAWPGDIGEFAGYLFAESLREKTGMLIKAAWTPDEDRPDIIANIAAHIARPEDEWLAAEQARVRAEMPADDAPATPASAVPASADTQTVEGEYTVLSVHKPPVKTLPPKAPEMTWDQARRTLNAMVEDAKERGVVMKEIEAVTGRKRTWIRDNLTNPAIEAGSIVCVRSGRDHRYTAVEYASAA